MRRPDSKLINSCGYTEVCSLSDVYTRASWEITSRKQQHAPGCRRGQHTQQATLIPCSELVGVELDASATHPVFFFFFNHQPLRVWKDDPAEWHPLPSVTVVDKLKNVGQEDETDDDDDAAEETSSEDAELRAMEEEQRRLMEGTDEEEGENDRKEGARDAGDADDVEDDDDQPAQQQQQQAAGPVEV